MSRVSNENLSTRGRRLAAGASPQRSQVLLLSNGRYTVGLSAQGSGSSDWQGAAVTRATDDPLCDFAGLHVYLRDLDDHFVWSAGYQPTRVEADHYEFHGNSSVAELARSDRDIECRLTVYVSPQHDCELRRCRLTNLSARTRRIELTSYLEWVLADRTADANHPAFSKLFVETDYCATSRAIVARRRPRGSGEVPMWGVHAVVFDESHELGTALAYETNRAAFVGRGRTLARPRALDPGARLAGFVGPVLDPIASLRLIVTLEPGQSEDVAFVLGAASRRDDIEAMLAAARGLPEVNAALDAAISAASSTNGTPTGTVHGAADQRFIIHQPHRVQSHSVGRQIADSPPPGHDEPGPARRDKVQSRAADSNAPLQFDNGYGGFSADGREYIIRMPLGSDGEPRRPPMPWVNVVANETAGFIVSESGAGYTWAGNSRLNRLTAWHNDPISDPHSEAIWVRDEETGDFWSVTPGPTPAAAAYTVRHGFGYTTFEHDSHELSQSTTLFMAPSDPVKVTRVRLVNRSARPRRLALFCYQHWSLGGLASETLGAVSTRYDSELRAILATNPGRAGYGGQVAFSAVATSEDIGQIAYTCDRANFLGASGDVASPAALLSAAKLDRRVGSGLDPCAAWQVPLVLPPTGEGECVFLLGEATGPGAAAAILERYRGAGQVDERLRETTQFWRDTTSTIQVETPDSEIDLLVNGWLTYQNLSCRMWARSAYYQPGGAFGFRDQLQDAAALVWVRPDLTRAQIVRHAGQQFVEGDVLHWWHPDTGFGLRTRFSDDLLWLPYVTTLYADATADAGIWDEPAPFVEGPQIPAGDAESYLRPTDSAVTGTIYEHCCRAVDRGLTAGPHGLPLIGCGDWNDGFSRVGRLGRGESVWLGFFIHYVLGQMLPVCTQRGDDERAARYTACRERLAIALNEAGWDGAWYRRAYYDNGEPIGSAGSDECQIDALAQAWAVLTGIAPPERARMAMDAVEQRLVCRDAGLIKLLTPPFDRTRHDPGYIKGYVPGIRENGGQYTHGVLWVVRALAEMGRGTAAVELLKMLSPVWHTASAERAAIYQTEPYVVAADVYGEPPHVGRGGWTWYTGSAGWMFRVAVESIFGLTIDHGQSLLIKPSISAAWPCCRITYRLPGESTCYEFTLQNPNGRQTGLTSVTLDGREAVVENGAARVPLVHDGRVHRIVAVM